MTPLPKHGPTLNMWKRRFPWWKLIAVLLVAAGGWWWYHNHQTNVLAEQAETARQAEYQFRINSMIERYHAYNGWQQEFTGKNKNIRMTPIFTSEAKAAWTGHPIFISGIITDIDQGLVVIENDLFTRLTSKSGSRFPAFFTPIEFRLKIDQKQATQLISDCRNINIEIDAINIEIDAIAQIDQVTTKQRPDEEGTSRWIIGYGTCLDYIMSDYVRPPL